MKTLQTPRRVMTLIVLLLFSSMAWAGKTNEIAATNWLIVVNNPAACSGSPCSEADIFGPAFDPTTPTNPTMAAVCYLTGQSVQANGRATFAGRFAEGTLHGCFFPVVPAVPLVDAMAAEFHIVVQEHGYSLPAGDGLEDQVAYFLGACNPDCTDTQFAIHVPNGMASGTSNVYRFDGSMVAGGVSTIIREADGVRVVTHTRLDK